MGRTNKMRISVISIILGILLIAFIGVATIVTNNQSQIAFAEPAEPHDHSGWTAWTTTTSLPTVAGSYYLTADVTLSSTWTVPTGTVNLCLCGHGIKKTGSGSVIKVGEGATLKLYDCDTTTEHKYSLSYAKSNGAGFATVNDGLTSGYQTFKGGYITGGTGTAVSSWNRGGAFYIEGTVEMYGGTVIGNGQYDVTHGGAFNTQGSGAFRMYGGSIQNNAGKCGGATRLQGDNARCEIYGGKIINNIVSADGGAIHVGGSIPVILQDCEISGNYAGNGPGAGIWMTTTGTVISGRTIITNNLTSSGESNVEIGNVYVIGVGELTEGARIGIIINNVHTGIFTSGWSTNMNGKDPADYFTSDIADYTVIKDNNGELMMIPENAVAVVENGTAFTYYIDFDSALSAWTDGSTLKLLKDVNISSTIVVSSGTKTLDLNGHGIKLNGSGSVFVVLDDSYLNIYDCDTTTEHRFTVNDATPNGAGLAVINDALTGSEGTDYLTFNGGYITGGNANPYGGGVRIGLRGKFEMFGGTIIGNTATSHGGGVCVSGADVGESGTQNFIMHGGKICYNKANWGGGIAIYGQTYITGNVAISNNVANSGGAGIELEKNGRLYMNCGSITDNVILAQNGGMWKGGGVHVPSGSEFHIGGDLQIKDNYQADGETNSNLFIRSGLSLTIDSALNQGAFICVELQDGMDTFTSGWATYMGNADPADYFTSDDAQYVIGLVNGEAALLLPMTAEAEGYEGDYDGDAHGITVTPSVTGTTIKYGASADACTFDTLTYANAGTHTVYYEVKKTGYATVKGSATVTISAISLTITITGHNDTVEYDGTKHSVTGFDVADGAGLYTESDLTFSGTAVAEQTNAGTTHMGLTSEMFTNTNTNFATVTFIVTDGYVTVLTVDAVVTTAPVAVDPVFDGEEKVLIVAGVADGGTLQYALGGYESAPEDGFAEELPVATEAGTYYVWYKVVADGNHNDVAAVCVKVTLAEPAWVTLNGVIQANNNPVESADVVLMKGNQKVDFVTTAADGAYRFIVPTGVYNVVVKYDNRTETTIVMLFKDEEKNIVLSDGKTESKLEVVTEEGEEIGIAVGGLDEEARAIREAEQIDDSKDVSVVMIVEPKEEDDEEKAEDIKDILDQAEDKSLRFFEIKVEKTVGLDTTILEETSNVLEIVIPYAKTNKRGLIVYSYHGNAVRTFEESDTKEDGTFRVDKENGLIYVYANKFSTYAIGYTPYYRIDTSVTLGSYTGKATVRIQNKLDEDVAFMLEDVELDNIVFDDVPKGEYLMTITWTDGKTNTLTMSMTVGPKPTFAPKTEEEAIEEEPAEDEGEDDTEPDNAACLVEAEETEFAAEEDGIELTDSGYQVSVPVDVAITNEKQETGEDVRSFPRKRDDDK